MTKDQRTIKAQATQIAGLTNEIAMMKSDLETARRFRDQYEAELSDIHRTFDLLGVPACVKNTYRDLSASARLTLFLAQTNCIKVEQPKEGD